MYRRCPGVIRLGMMWRGPGRSAARHTMASPPFGEQFVNVSIKPPSRNRRAVALSTAPGNSTNNVLVQITMVIDRICFVPLDVQEGVGKVVEFGDDVPAGVAMFMAEISEPAITLQKQPPGRERVLCVGLRKRVRALRTNTMKFVQCPKSCRRLLQVRRPSPL